MKNNFITAFIGCSLMTVAEAAVLTFDGLIPGATSYTLDADADGVKDVIFSTSDPSGMNTSGPGALMSHIQEPGLEGPTSLPTDIRVDFLRGARHSLKFGFALATADEDKTLTFTIYDASDTPLASQTQTATYTWPGGNRSNFPEGLITVDFPGTAAYATFDASLEDSRFIIDNFQGTYGSTEIPESGSLFGLLCLTLAGLYRMQKTRQPPPDGGTGSALIS